MMTRPDSRDFFVTVFVVVGFVRSIGAAAARVAPADASPSEKGGVVSENRVLHGEVAARRHRSGQGSTHQGRFAILAFSFSTAAFSAAISSRAACFIKSALVWGKRHGMWMG